MEKKTIKIMITSLIFITIAGFFYYNQVAYPAQDGNEIFISNGETLENNTNVTDHSIEMQDYIEENSSTSEAITICVHVCGAVKKPGVYTFDKHVRISDVIQAAKGLKKNADDVAINQAEFVQDGMQIYIPYKGDMEEKSNSVQKDNESNSLQQEAEQGKININTATPEQLMTLTGIGKEKANKIIAYREEHGAFQAIEDIMKITGIKDGIFQKIKEAICI